MAIRRTRDGCSFEPVYIVIFTNVPMRSKWGAGQFSHWCRWEAAEPNLYIPVEWLFRVFPSFSRTQIGSELLAHSYPKLPSIQHSPIVPSAKHFSSGPYDSTITLWIWGHANSKAFSRHLSDALSRHQGWLSLHRMNRDFLYSESCWKSQ